MRGSSAPISCMSWSRRPSGSIRSPCATSTLARPCASLGRRHSVARLMMTHMRCPADMSTVVIVYMLILTSGWTGGRPICDRLAKVFGKPIGFLRCREYAVADICSPARQRFLQQLKTIRISANKFGAMTFHQA